MSTQTRRPRLSSRSRRVGLAVAVAAVALLSACGPLKAGSAAIVGDASLSETQLANQAQEIRDLTAAKGVPMGLSNSQLNVQLINWWVLEQLTTELAAKHGITVTQTQVDQFLGNFTAADLVNIAASNGVGPSGIDAAARAQLTLQPLGQKLAPNASQQDQQKAIVAEVGKLAAEVGVSINPRYGSFDVQTGQVVAPDPQRLSSPVTSATPGAPVGTTPQG